MPFEWRLINAIFSNVMLFRAKCRSLIVHSGSVDGLRMTGNGIFQNAFYIFIDLFGWHIKNGHSFIYFVSSFHLNFHLIWICVYYLVSPQYILNVDYFDG